MLENTVSKKMDDSDDAGKAEVTLPGVVEKVIPPLHANEPEKAQIAVEGAEDLYRELRVENALQDSEGKPVKLKEGAEVEVTIAADPDDTLAKDSVDSNGNKKRKHKTS